MMGRNDMSNIVYHICRQDEWDAAKVNGFYSGSSQDEADGFIHFSASDQVVESARRHRAGQNGLVLLSVDAESLGSSLKWEPSRGGLLFPHLYSDLPVNVVINAISLPLGPDGQFIFPKSEISN